LEQAFSVLFSLYHGTPDRGEWAVSCLEGAWPKLLGDRLATVCRPVAFRNSELSIELLDPAWEDALRNIQPALLEKLQAATAGEVRSIIFRKPTATT
jgi:hypothetical protein